MDILRNFINISGLADSGDIPENKCGEVIKYSETETIFIPKGQPDIKSIFQILLDVQVTSTRCISDSKGITVVLDGIKKIKIIYTQNDNSGKASFLNLELPYNTFVELPKTFLSGSINIFITDAYFSLLDERRIYSHLLYFIDVSNIITGKGTAFSLDFTSCNNKESKDLILPKENIVPATNPVILSESVNNGENCSNSRLLKSGAEMQAAKI